ncbi:MAG: c-type cytochrome, partial [Planctomycetaceae bacterium]|nr:c-type cytochrome [Planctomycetaceae bacterium]
MLSLHPIVADADPVPQDPALPDVAAGTSTHPVVPGYERFREELLSPEAAGMLLISELNCQSCHGRILNEAMPMRKAPILTEVSTRLQPEFLMKFLADPQHTKPGTLMPKVLSGPDALQSATALTHFLVSDGAVIPSPVSADAIRRGEQLFHSIGCAACHGDLRKPASDRQPFAVPLGTLSEKYTVTSLSEFLRNPHAVRPSGRMPALNLDEKESRDIACFLMPDVDVEPRLTFEVYKGSWEQLPNFADLEPVARGAATDFDVAVTELKNGFALRFHGWLHLPRPGEYRFRIGSDDGSRLRIDGEEVVAADGIHPHQTAEASRTLTAEPHEIVVEYFEGGGEESLSVEVSGPELGWQPLAGFVSNSKQPPQQSRAFQTDPLLTEAGRRLFVSAGCAVCHQHGSVKDDEVAAATGKVAPPFRELNLSTGCLSDQPPEFVPAFGLTSTQRQDIAAAVRKLAAGQQVPNDAVTPDKTTAAANADAQSVIHTVLLTLNCYACHQRNDIGGVPRE